METTLELGATIDTLTRGELTDALAAQTQESFRQLARGCKYMRLPSLQATIASSAFTLDGTGGGAGPREGFVWSIRRLAVAGLTRGATPDVIEFYRDSTATLPVWELNGNNWATTFGKLELLLLPGETLAFASQGTIAATGTVTVTGDVLEVAAEEIYKLF